MRPYPKHPRRLDSGTAKAGNENLLKRVMKYTQGDNEEELEFKLETELEVISNLNSALREALLAEQSKQELEPSVVGEAEDRRSKS